MSLEKPMPASQLRKDSYYLKRSRAPAFSMGRGKEQRKKEQPCSFMPFAKGRQTPRTAEKSVFCSVHTLHTGRDSRWEARPPPLRSPEHRAVNAYAVMTVTINCIWKVIKVGSFVWTASTQGLCVLLWSVDMLIVYACGNHTSNYMLLHILIEIIQ